MELAKNKKAYFDYEILETHEAGIELLGYEVKSVREKHINLNGSYISVTAWELYLRQAHIGAWSGTINKDAVETQRLRKIFLPRKKIIFFDTKMKQGGYTLLALRFYLKGSLIKVEVGLARGKKKHEKKQVLKERTLDREAKKHLKKNYL